jgi:hypothetical protein
MVSCLDRVNLHEIIVVSILSQVECKLVVKYCFGLKWVFHQVIGGKHKVLLEKEQSKEVLF